MELPRSGATFHDRYSIGEVLGEGGFAVVYRADDHRAQRAVAIKVLRPDDNGYELTLAARFLRELGAISKLSDPHTLTLYDFGRTEEGLLFMVFELIEGYDLSTLIERGPTPERGVVSILLQVLSSLREAHTAGILHRDIKPSNIRIRQIDGHVKVLDFGLAKSWTMDQSNLTATGQVIGTARYMAPEQLMGTALSPATDLYALGIVGMELATGSVRRELRPEDPVSPRLRAVFERMTRTDMHERYATAGDVIAALRSEHVPAERVPAPSVPRRPVPPTKAAPARSLDPRIVPIAAALGIVAASAIGVAVVLTREEPEPVSPKRSANVISKLTKPPSDAPPEETEAAVVPLGPCDKKPRFGGVGKLRIVDGFTASFFEAYVPESSRAGDRLAVLVVSHASAYPSTILTTPQFVELAEREKVVLLSVDLNANASDPEKPSALEVALSAAALNVCVDEARIFALLTTPKDPTAYKDEPNPWFDRCPSVFAAVASVGYRLPAEVCPDKPHIYITGKEDLADPVMAPPKLISGTRRYQTADDVKDRSKRMFCAKAPPLDEYRAEATAGRECTDKVASWAPECTLSDCAAPFGVCIVDSGRPLPSAQFASKSSCWGEDQRPTFAAEMWKFFDIVTSPTAYADLEFQSKP